MGASSTCSESEGPGDTTFEVVLLTGDAFMGKGSACRWTGDDGTGVGGGVSICSGSAGTLIVRAGCTGWFTGKKDGISSLSLSGSPSYSGNSLDNGLRGYFPLCCTVHFFSFLLCFGETVDSRMGRWSHSKSRFLWRTLDFLLFFSGLTSYTGLSSSSCLVTMYTLSSQNARNLPGPPVSWFQTRTISG